MSKGNILFDLLEYKDALVEFDTTITLNPTDGNNYLNRAKVYSTLTMYKKAIDDYTTAENFLKESQSRYKILTNRGECYLKLQLVDEAIIDLQRACEIDSENADAQNIFGLALFESTRYENALDKFSKAIELDR